MIPKENFENFIHYCSLKFRFQSLETKTQRNKDKSLKLSNIENIIILLSFIATNIGLIILVMVNYYENDTSKFWGSLICVISADASVLIEIVIYLVKDLHLMRGFFLTTVVFSCTAFYGCTYLNYPSIPPG